MGIEAKRRGVERHGNGNSAGQPDARHITVVVRFEDDDFIAGIDETQKGGMQRLRDAGRDGDFRFRIDFLSVKACRVRRDGRAQAPESICGAASRASANPKIEESLDRSKPPLDHFSPDDVAKIVLPEAPVAGERIDEKLESKPPPQR